MFKLKSILSGLLISILLLMSLATVQAQLDDPTRPPGYRLALPGGKKAATAIYYSLSSVRISPSRRSAVVNDRTVESGDVVNGAKVIAIYPAAVKLKKKGKTFTIRLVSQMIKKARIQ